MVDDHFHGHPAAPDTSRAFVVVSPGIQATVSPGPVAFQIRRYTMKWWASRQIILGILDDLDTAGFVKGRRSRMRG